MKSYTVNQIIRFGIGEVLGLDDKQYGPRAHALEPVKKGIYKVISPVEFKAGEKISLESEPDKVMAQRLDPCNPKGVDKPESGNPEGKSGILSGFFKGKKEDEGAGPQKAGEVDRAELIAMAQEFGVENAESMSDDDLNAAINKCLEK